MNPKNAFDRVEVEFVGKRQANYRVKVFVDGNMYTPAGYVFGPGAKQETYRCEAEILAGEVKPDVDENGKVKTDRLALRPPLHELVGRLQRDAAPGAGAEVVDGDLGCDGLTGEAYKYSELPDRAANPCADSAGVTTEAAVEVAADTARRVVRRPVADSAQ